MAKCLVLMVDIVLGTVACNQIEPHPPVVGSNILW